MSTALHRLLEQLSDQTRFILYRREPTPDKPQKSNKIPCGTSGLNSNAQDPTTWMSGAEAHMWAEQLAAAPLPAGVLGYGVGVVLNGDGLFCIDIDSCRDANGGWMPHAVAFCQQFPGALVEVSISGNGLHIFGWAQAGLPAHGNKNKSYGMEAYTSGRFIALGNHAQGDCRTDLTAPFTEFLHRYFPPRDDAADGEWTDKPVAEWRGPSDDAELIRRAERSNSARSFVGKSASFHDLHHANDTDVVARIYAGDDSAADLAYFNHLAFWTGKDAARMERIALLSGLRRDKWDREDYRRGTILRACASQKSVYQGKGDLPPAVPAVTPNVTADGEPIPQARHLATDQKNVDRIIAAYGTRLLSVGGKLYAWSGCRWEPDTGLARRFAGNLSRIVAEERERAEAQIAELAKQPEIPRGEMYAALVAVVESLEKWGPKCEMAATQNAALKMLVEAVKIDADKLDADPLLINLENGTYNVATGELQPHNPLDYITKLAPVRFDATATCPRFDQFLTEVFDSKPVGDFSMRWFGYCATGETKEQYVVIHWGHGANGKGTLIWKCIAPVLGDYAGAGAPGLLTAKNEDQRHPAEIADLFGKRMVTCSESDEGATLREGFVKQASGEDKLKGRFLHGQFFEFTPTHKLQLMTNKKPLVKGTDHGTWRRLLMLPYLSKFGTPEEIEAGKANKPRDNNLDVALKAEWPGILNRIIEGAREWRRAGLRPPPVVLEASEAYRQEQDRIGEFVREELTVDPNARTDSTKLYAHYAAWDAGTGMKPLASKPFLTELDKHVPGFRRAKSNGVRWIYGVAITSQLAAPAPPPPLA